MVLLTDSESINNICSFKGNDDSVEGYNQLLSYIYRIFIKSIDINEVFFIDFTNKFKVPDVPKCIGNITKDLNSIYNTNFSLECSEVEGDVKYLFKSYKFNISSTEPWIVGIIKINFLHIGMIRLEEGYITEGMVRTYIGQDKVIFIPNLLTPAIIPLLIEIKNKTGFRQTYFDNKTIFQSYHQTEIKNINDYLENTLYLKSFYDRDNIEIESPPIRIPSKYQFSVSEEMQVKLNNHYEIYSLHETSLWNTFRSCVSGLSKKILLESGDTFLSNKFIEELQGHVNEYIVHDCSNGEYELKKTKKTLIFKSIDMLSKQKLFNLVAEIKKPKFKNKIVVLQSSTILDDFPFDVFDRVKVPTFDQCKDNLHLFFWLIVNQKNIFIQKTNDGVNPFREEYYLSIMKVFNNLFFQTKSLNNLYNTVKFVMPILNPLNITADIISDLEEYITITYNSNLPPENVPNYDFEFTHNHDEDTGKDYWTVVDSKNQKEYKRLPYKKDFAFVCMVYFIKFKEIFKSNKINTEYLYKSIKEYQRRNLKKPPKRAEHNITEAFRAYFLMISNEFRYKNKYTRKAAEELKSLRKSLKELFEEFFVISNPESTLRSGINVKINDEELEQFITEKNKQKHNI